MKWKTYPENVPEKPGDYFITTVVDWGCGKQAKVDIAYFTDIHKVFYERSAGKCRREKYPFTIIAFMKYREDVKPEPYSGNLDVPVSGERNDNVLNYGKVGW